MSLCSSPAVTKGWITRRTSQKCGTNSILFILGFFPPLFYGVVCNLADIATPTSNLHPVRAVHSHWPPLILSSPANIAERMMYCLLPSCPLVSNDEESLLVFLYTEAILGLCWTIIVLMWFTKCNIKPPHRGQAGTSYACVSACVDCSAKMQILISLLVGKSIVDPIKSYRIKVYLLHTESYNRQWKE